ncbi:MAG TPA: type I-E CRISPR-associated protein Cse1/CasA [Thermoanaerobaculia bacterium]|nr:type I-E CRISPR-associated protein Cse1/CasA [Thermoanaerobaculia bacterium]
MNLLLDPWIPLRRRSGPVETVPPWQITDRHEDDPFTGFASVRPDFDGALAQFLIGLLQTALAPERARDWRQRFEPPPSPDTLREAFEPLAFAFELFGDGPRFLQDLTLEADEPSEERIERLLIEAPGENTLRQGRDHFVKGDRIDALCPACAATALLTLQINAPSGGQGHRTGLRGGGPLTTLVVHPENLWKTLWLNVLLSEDLAGEPRGKVRPEDRFPWLAPTRTSGKDSGRDTTLADVHPLQVYWAMPRRIRLRPSSATEPAEAACSLCAGFGRPLVRTFFNRNLGVNYAGAWNHPLTPYRKADADYLPLHGSPAGLSYRNWLGLVQNDPDHQIRPAAVVNAFLGDDGRRKKADYVLWAFGYDMDNMKARAWLDGRMPLLLISPEHREAFELDARRLVLSAAEAAGALVFAAKRALTDRPKEMAHDPADVGVRFWQETEAPFYEHLRQIHGILEADSEDTTAPRRHWLSQLWRTANEAFKNVTVVGSFEAADPKRAAIAWNGLQFFFRGDKLKKLLGLPAPPKKTGKKTISPQAETGDPR